VTAFGVRAASPDDVDALYEVRRRAMSTHVDPWLRERGALWSDERSRAHFVGDFDPACQVALLVDGRIAGRLKVLVRPDHVELTGIEVLPEHQGRGIGTRVIEDVLSVAGGRDLPVRLRVFQGNPAYRLYERLGFRRTGADDLEYTYEARPARQSGPPHSPELVRFLIARVSLGSG